MRLLIVDDQKAVVDGLLKQDWTASGIEHAIGACNAAQARCVLAEYEVDVMLCDIEMPVEDGLSLVKWMRDQGMATKCIFLTAHAEFSYAQKSVGLGAFDYVVQPAPYAEIRLAVERAVQAIEQEHQQARMEKYGHITSWKNKHEAASALKNYLLGAGEQELQPFLRRGELPQEDQTCYLVSLQIQRWFSFEKWSDDLLGMMMDNAVGEVFSPGEQRFVVTEMGSERFALLLWEPHAATVPERVPHQLSFLYNVCRKQLQCTLSLYPSGPVRLRELQTVWQTLIESQAQNVDMRTGVFVQQDAAASPQTLEAEQAAVWRGILYAGSQAECGQKVRQRFTLLCGESTQEEALEHLKREFFTSVQEMTGNADKFWRKVLVDAGSYDTYRNSEKSFQDLMELIFLVHQRLSQKNQERDERIVESIVRYIDAHLDKEIHRSDLADAVYLNPDYLNRLFKKQTGKTLKEFVTAYKMNEAKKMLQVTRLPVSIIAAKVGYDNFSHFSYTYKKINGQSPMETRNEACQTEKKGENSS